MKEELLQKTAAKSFSPYTILAGTFMIFLGPFLLVELFPAQLDAVIDKDSYLVFHNIVEFFSIMVSLAVFSVGWYTYDQSKDRHALFLGTAFLAVGLLDFMHTLSNAAMPAFISPNSTNKSTQFWIAARLFDSAAFLLSAYVYSDKQHRLLSKKVLMSGALAVTGLAFAGIVFFPSYLPATAVPGIGLTPLKRILEFVVILFLLLALVAYWKRMMRTGDRLILYYLAAFIICIFSEAVFASYHTGFDTHNVLGHIYKAIAFYLIYQGVFASSVRKPYVALSDTNEKLLAEISERRKAEEALRRYQEHLAELVAERTRQLSAANEELQKDIDERRQAEEKLAAAHTAVVNEKNLLEAVMQALPVGLSILDAHGGVLHANPAFEKIWGGPRPATRSVDDYAAYKAWWADTGRTVAPAEWASAIAIQTGETVVGQLLRVQRFDGSSVFIINSASPVLDAAGNIAGCVVAVQDITELKRAEAALREHELKASALINAAGESIWLFGLHDEILVANTIAARRVGKTVAEVVGNRWTDLIPSELAASRRRKVEELLRTGSPVRFEDERAGMFFDHTVYPVHDDRGEIAAVAFFSRDITERRKAEERIRNQTMILEGINAVFQVAMTSDTEEELGRACLTVAEEVTGSSFGFIGELGGDGFLHDTAISDPGWNACTMYDKTGHRRPSGSFRVHGLYGRVLLDGKAFFTNDPALHPDSIGTPEGHPPLKAFLGVPLIHGGKTIGMLAVGNRAGGYRHEDLKALEVLSVAIVQALMRKRAEADVLTLSEEMAARNLELEDLNRELEAFIYSVSHDLRAPLRSVSGFAKFLAEDCADRLDDEGRNYLERITAGAEKMSRLIEDLLDLSRLSRQEVRRSEVDLSALAASIVSGLRETDPGRRVEVSIAEGLTAWADPSLMEIMLSNLIENAWKFTSKNQDARIEFGVKPPAQANPPAQTNPPLHPSQEGTVYYVRDNGAGFDPQYAAPMFQPFHRLHAGDEFEGTGIGLAIVERVIRKHDGKVWAEGAVGKGATFYFTVQ